MLFTNEALSTSMLRVSTAAQSGVRPYQSAALMFAPLSIRNRATSGWLLVMAMMSGVMPLASVCSMSAPRAEQHAHDLEPAVARGVEQRRHGSRNRRARAARRQAAADDADAVAEAGDRIRQDPVRRRRRCASSR